MDSNDKKIYNETLIAARSIIELEDLTLDFNNGVSLIRESHNIPEDLLNLIRGA